MWSVMCVSCGNGVTRWLLWRSSRWTWSKPHWPGLPVLKMTAICVMAVKARTQVDLVIKDKQRKQRKDNNISVFCRDANISRFGEWRFFTSIWVTYAENSTQQSGQSSEVTWVFALVLPDCSWYSSKRQEVCLWTHHLLPVADSVAPWKGEISVKLLGQDASSLAVSLRMY